MFGLVTSSFPFYEGIELVGFVMGISGLLMFGLALVSRFASRWTARKPSESDSVSVPGSAFPQLWRKSGDSYMAVGIAALLAAEFFEITSR
jgi:hypothetical protein